MKLLIEIGYVLQIATHPILCVLFFSIPLYTKTLIEVKNILFINNTHGWKFQIKEWIDQKQWSAERTLTNNKFKKIGEVTHIYCSREEINCSKIIITVVWFLRNSDTLYVLFIWLYENYVSKSTDSTKIAHPSQAYYGVFLVCLSISAQTWTPVYSTVPKITNRKWKGLDSIVNLIEFRVAIFKQLHLMM